MNNLIHIYYIRQAEKLSEEVFQILFHLPNAMQIRYCQLQALAKCAGFFFRKNNFAIRLPATLQINHSFEELKTTEKGRPFIIRN